MMDALYLANPAYGGWVTFTAHLLHYLKPKQKVRLFKISASGEVKPRAFGYGLQYLNIKKEWVAKAERPLVLAIDKDHYDVLQHLPRGTRLVIHDPTELRPELLEHLDKFELITLRRTVQRLLKEAHGLNSHFAYHPFYQYPRDIEIEKFMPAVSISRIDFDKHTDIILSANRSLGKDAIEIYGAANRIYVYHKLRTLGFDKYYRGTYEKSFASSAMILDPARWVVDMSTIKRDGAGTQYTFLEAIHHRCGLVLNDAWFENGTEELIPEKNCLSVGNDAELKSACRASEKVRLRLVNAAAELLSKHTLDKVFA
jgi:hypothetical protein